jgi:type VI secretion system protein ImpE
MSSTVDAAEQALQLGDLGQALQLLQDGVRAKPADVKLRIFLFQLLSVQGQWARALNQLKVCGEMDAATLPMVNTYREALQCEAVREAVFKGQTTPIVLGQPQAWVAHLVEALLADQRGDTALAAHLRAQALADAPTTAGTVNGEAFGWIADADSRLGPVLEVVVNGRYGWVPFASLASVTFDPPEDLRDMVWLPATLGFPNGGSTVALVPTRYAPMPEGADGQLLLARRTEWEAIGEDQFRGLGQRLLTTDNTELGLLDVRALVLHNAETGAADATVAQVA